MPSMLSWINLADTAMTITATREATGLGVRNLLTEPLGQVWRVPVVAAGTATNLDITFAAPVSIGVIAIFAPRDSVLAEATTLRLLGSLSALGGTDALDIAATTLSMATNRGAWWYWPAAAVTLQYLRLRFIAQDPDAYLQLGRLWVGPDFRPTYGGWTDGFTRGWRDAGSIERAAVTGVPSAVNGTRMRAPVWSLPLLTDAEADQVEAAAASRGITRQLIANPRTQRGAKDLLLGRFTAPPSPAVSAMRRFKAEISMLEDC